MTDTHQSFDEKDQAEYWIREERARHKTTPSQKYLEINEYI